MLPISSPFLLFALILFYPILSTAIPTLNSSEPMSALNGVTPQCFYPGSHHDICPTNLADCKKALQSLVREPNFTQYQWFSRNHRRGIQVPKGWRWGNCIIFTSCENDYDADTYRYSDVLRKAKAVIDLVSNLIRQA